MIKAVIIDDEPLARSVVREYLDGHPQITCVKECGDGFEGVKAVGQHNPDLLFLDIQMPKVNGFEMLELLDEPPAVIFTTAFDEYAMKAFEAHAVDYLLKPFSKERFDRAIEKFITGPGPHKKATQLLVQNAAMREQAERIVIKTSGQIKIIPVRDISHIEAADDYVKLHTKDGAFLKNKTMGFFEQTLDSHQFVRTHRSFIVNVQEITRIDPYEKEAYLAILRSGQRIPVSKNGYGKLREVLGI